LRPWNPIHIIYRLGTIALVAVLLGCLLPGLIAYKDHVFFVDGLREHVAKRYPAVVDELRSYEAARERTERQIVALDDLSPLQINATDRAVLRQSYEQDLKKQAPYSLQPFYLHIIMFFWPIMYFGLFTAIWVIRPPGSRLTPREMLTAPTLLLGLGLFLCSAVPLWFRVWIAESPSVGRKVFAYSNPDVSLISFSVQMLNFAMFSWALAVIWRQWTDYASRQRSALAEIKDSNELNCWLMDELSGSLFRFQGAFLIISSGFVVYTGIFWTQIVRHGDMRFMAEAISAHLLWFGTITVISTPVVMTWYSWRSRKNRVLLTLINDAGLGSTELESRISSIQDLDPIPKWNITASIAAILTTVAGPFIQAFIK
jgi:hypothetical protein